MRKRHCSIAAIALILASNFANAGGPYVSKVETVSIAAEGSAYTAVFLDLDITNSPCSSTNQHDRFTLISDGQISVVLLAVATDSDVTVYSNGVCDTGSNIEEASSIRIAPP